MTTATLVASILQLATLILSGVSNNYNIPQSTRDQAVAIAQSSVNFASQNMAYLQGGTYYNPYNCTYNCNYNPYPIYNSSYATRIMVLSSENYDTTSVSRNATYNLVWSPYNPSQGFVDMVLYSAAYGSAQNIGRVNSNNIIWTVSASSGTYELRLMQNGAIVASRTVTVQ